MIHITMITNSEKKKIIEIHTHAHPTKIRIYLALKSADMPAHGNESEGSILLAQSNAFLANWFSPSSR